MNIFVAKLNSLTNADDLQAAFEKFGTVESAKVIYDRETEASKGFGFVEMADDKEATEAIEKLDRSDLNGNTIVVKQAHAKESNR